MPSLRKSLMPALALFALHGIADAQTTDSLGRRRTVVLPAIGAAPETGLQLGITAFVVTDAPAVQHKRPSSLTATAIRSFKAQTRISLDGERWSTNNDWRVALASAWQRFPLPFYGFGDSATANAKEVYTPQGFDATLTVQRRLLHNVYAVAGAHVIDQHIVDTDSSGALQLGTIVGSTGGRTTELQGGVLVDTRDNLFSARTGTFGQLLVSRAGALSDFTFTRVRADVRRYQSFGAHTFALHGLVHRVSKGAPFDQVALVGDKDIMRGYARGRYRDNWMAAAQAEYRSPLFHRVGGVVYGGAGTVANTFADIGNGRVVPTYGAGLRAQMDAQQRTAIRVDYARGESGSSGFYIGFNQAF